MPLLVLSLGDPNGIGPFVLLHAAARWLEAGCPARLLACASGSFLESVAASCGLTVPMQDLTGKELDELQPGVLGWISPSMNAELPDWPGRPSRSGGEIAWSSLDCARDLVAARPASRALVTAPICKESMQLAGFKWPGHTEYLEAKDPGSSSLMWLHSDRISVGLVTNHEPLDRIASCITPQRVESRVRQLCDHLRRHHPGEVLQVLAPNPHAGDGGLLGKQESDWLCAQLANLASEGLPVSGPWPADAALSRGRGRFLAMYHDQGLPVFKLVAGMSGVNVTLGLSHIRTSPDHGTAFDLENPCEADPGSQYAAMREALKMLGKRPG